MVQNYESRFVPYTAHQHVGKGPALVFAPHPDDEVIGCGGAVLKHLENSDPLKIIVATDGRLGDPELAGRIYQKTAEDIEVDAYVKRRYMESRQAGKQMGYTDVEFWGYQDRSLSINSAVISKVIEAIERFCPKCIYAPSVYEMHPDHRALAQIILKAISQMRARPDLFMYEIGRPIPSPDILLDITNCWDRIETAIGCFESQIKVCPFDEFAYSLKRFRAFTTPPEVMMAEAYIWVRGDWPGDPYADMAVFMALDEKRVFWARDWNDGRQKEVQPSGMKTRILACLQEQELFSD